MARADRRDGVRLDAPKGLRTPFVPRWQGRDRFGRFTEAIARGMGTPWFLMGHPALPMEPQKSRSGRGNPRAARPLGAQGPEGTKRK